MNDAPWDPVAAVAALRTSGTMPHDAVRLHYLEALARRAQGFDGDVKNLLQDALRQALADYPSTHSTAQSPAPTPRHHPPHHYPLGQPGEPAGTGDMAARAGGGCGYAGCRW